MRKIEQEIVKTMWELRNTNKERQLSPRDHVRGTDNGVFYRLHGTVVAHLSKSGTIQTWTGGWRTPTTKSRINAILTMLGSSPYWGIYQEDFIWYWFGGLEYEEGDKVDWVGDERQVVRSVM